jgi:ABC-type sugar transport system ATPase subunit
VAKSRLSAAGISVTFNGVTVLRDADLDIGGGEILGLLGANGSGKSTMVKVLTGVYRADHGAAITVNGTTLRPEHYGPLAARASGIRVVHQEAPLVPLLTVAETVALELGFATAGGFIHVRNTVARARRVLAEHGIEIDPARTAASLSASERATVSLALALADVEPERAILILDEATASLSTAEAHGFLELVRREAEAGLAVLMVTHRLPEVSEFCDRVMVLSDGEVVERCEAAGLDERRILRSMVGRSGEVEPVEPVAAPALETHPDGAAVAVTGLRGGSLRGVDLSVRPGEILGIAGRAGGGAADVLRLLAGMDPRKGGDVSIGGDRVSGSGPRPALMKGIVYVSADRLREGGIASMSVAENLVLPRVERYWLDRGREAEDVARMIELLDIRPSDPKAKFGTLSGGNQQKVLIARWLLLEPRVLVLDDPTAGVDPNTRELLFGLLRRSADDGLSIVIRSTEPEQLARLCDRVLVLRDGEIVKSLERGLVNTEEISLATFA